jgi:hypothetical protein
MNLAKQLNEAQKQIVIGRYKSQPHCSTIQHSAKFHGVTKATVEQALTEAGFEV